MNRKVPLRRAETSQRISAQIALPERKSGVRVSRWRSERSWVKGFVSGILRSVQVERLSSDNIRANIRVIVQKLQQQPVRNIDRRGRTSPYDILQRPTAQKGVRETIDFGGWNVIRHPYRKRVAD